MGAFGGPGLKTVDIAASVGNVHDLRRGKPKKLKSVGSVSNDFIPGDLQRAAAIDYTVQFAQAVHKLVSESFQQRSLLEFMSNVHRPSQDIIGVPDSDTEDSSRLPVLQWPLCGMSWF